MHRVRCAVGDVAGEVRDHDADRAGQQAHRHDRGALGDPQHCRRAGDADPPADGHDQHGAGRRREPRHRGHRAHQRGSLLGVADDLRQAHREEALEGDHREAPEQLDRDQREEDPRRPQQSDAIGDHLRDGAHGARDRARAAGPSRLGHEQRDRQRVDHAEPERDEERQREGRDRLERVKGDERTRQQRAERDGKAEDRAAAAQSVLDLGSRLGVQRRVDVPRLERAAVEGTEDTLECHRGGEQRHRIRDVQQPQRDEPDEAGDDQDRPAAERVGESAGRQLQREHDQALDAEDESDLGQRQAARQRQQDGHRDQQAGRQPAQGDQHQVAAARGTGVEGGHGRSSGSGKAWRWTWTASSSGSPAERR